MNTQPRHLGYGGIPKVGEWTPAPNVNRKPLWKYEERLIAKISNLYTKKTEETQIVDPSTGHVHERFRTWLNDNKVHIKHYFHLIMKSIEKLQIILKISEKELYKKFVAFVYSTSTMKNPVEYHHLKV